MFNTKTLLAAASLAVLTAAGAANAAPWDNAAQAAHQDLRHDMRNLRQDRRDMRADRRAIDRDRVFASLRLHHLRAVGEPFFVRNHYVVRVVSRFGRPRLIEVNPYSGALIGEFQT